MKRFLHSRKAAAGKGNAPIPWAGDLLTMEDPQGKTGEKRNSLER